MTANPFENNDDEETLDPALERTRLRLRRLILISTGTLGLGLLAIFGAILYKVIEQRSSIEIIADFAPMFDIPSGLEVINMGGNGNYVMIGVKDGAGGVSILWFDRQTGERLGQSIIE